jgi:isoquinoline 1-oxidoreductase subunit alpha
LWVFGSAIDSLRSAAIMRYTITVNGETRTADVDSDTPLLWVLRDSLDLKGTKFGCGMAMCGACTVHVNGVPTRSCVTPISSVGDAAVVTIEGIGQSEIGQRVQAAWLDVDVMQCGYCQAGQIMSATALLERNPQPTDRDIDAAMNGNICRCATYNRIRAAIKKAAEA